MSILNVALGALCLLLAFLVLAWSKGFFDPFGWAVVAVMVIGGFALPKLLHDTAGSRLLCNVLSLVTLFFLAGRQRRN
ncbi:hypothetical protein ACWCPT_25140 [Streptomyces sp. NPDC002308]